MQQHADELDRFKRDVHFVDYATTGYGYQVDRRESSRNSVVLRNPTSDDKLIVTRSAHDGHWTYFSVRDDRDNGSIVDFVQRRSNQNIGDVRQELRRWLGTPRPELPSDSPARRDVTPIPRDREAVLRVLAAAENVETSLYLNRRGLRPETLHEPRFAGSWKEDARGNVLFIHRDPAGVSGFESKNHGFTGFSAGGTKAVWHSQPQPTDNRLVIAESAIDALSYHQLHKDQHHRTRYMSMGGAPSPYQLELIDQALAKMPKGSAIVAAVDGDEAGKAREATRSDCCQASARRVPTPLARARARQGLERRPSARRARLHPLASRPLAPTHQRGRAYAMNTAVQLRDPSSPPPQCEVLHGTPVHVHAGALGPVAIFQPNQLVAFVMTTSARRRRLFLFRTIGAVDLTAAQVPGVHPRVALLLELRTSARIQKLQRLLFFLEKRGLDPSSMSDAFYLRVSHVLGGHLTAPKIVLSLMRHEDRR